MITSDHGAMSWADPARTVQVGNRRIHFADCTYQPTSCVGPTGTRPWPGSSRTALRARFLLRDRDSKFSAVFDGVFESEDVRVIRLPNRRQVANSIVEGFLRTCRREVLDHLLIFGRGHLERVLGEFIEHYNHARPHQGLEQSPPCEPADVVPLPTGRVERRDRLGGVFHEYFRAALPR